MGKYNGTLHKLIESACHSNSEKKWSQVLFYLEGHTVSNTEDAYPPRFESPLAPSMVPSSELERELFDQQGPKREDSPLKIAVRSAPANVVAALCHLGPDASKMVDGRKRLPIHIACRRSSEDPQTEKVLVILAKCNPESLLQRDDCGRTPLHWLFWFHANTRSPEIVRFFCQEQPYDLFLDIRQPQTSSNEKYALPEIHRPSEKMEIPQSAAIVHDSCHGALPLHYAVMQGASKESVRVLIKNYPGSTSVGDRRGRSPLAWYLGAGSLTEGNKTNVCGEANDPNMSPWWRQRLSMQLIQLLVSSKAARLVDRDMKRAPLHWACHFFAKSATSDFKSIDQSQAGPSISNKIFQIIVDHNIEALTFQDANGETPLHVMFSVVARTQDMERQRMKANRNFMATRINLASGGPAAFNPPKQLVELLLKCPDIDGQDVGHNYNDLGQPLVSAASLENESGLLPLHTALYVGTCTECIELLVHSNPTGLVHASEELMQTPLIHAFSSEFSAPLQSISSVEILLSSYPTSRHGTYMDGRLAEKMEDALGMYPIHYACQNEASFDIIKLFVEKFVRNATYQNADGDLPIHCLLSRDNLFSAPTSATIQGASLAEPLSLLTEKEKERQKELKEVQRLKMRILLEPLKTQDHLKLASSAHGMTPLHVAIAFNVLPYERIFHLLDEYPEANRRCTTEQSHKYSCIQLHDRRKEEADDQEEWQAIRELLYAFNPLAETHRREEELLDACSKLVRNEIIGMGSFHLQKSKDYDLKSPESIDINKTLSDINAPVAITSNFLEKQKRENALRLEMQRAGNQCADVPQTASPSFVSLIANKLSGKEENDIHKSIYDDDFQGQYVVSPQQSNDEDDVAGHFSGSSDGEEYDSEDEYASEDDLLSRTLGSDAVSQTLSQTLSYVKQGSKTGDRSLLRKAIGDRSKEENHEMDDEKKEDGSKPALFGKKDVELSPVGKRLWCFFVAYNNHKDPEDNYIYQVESILEGLEFDIVEQLIDLAVPNYATDLITPGISPSGLTMRDIASPKVKALFESYYLFLGRYEFSSDIDGVLLHRACDTNTIFIRATEHVLQTTKYQPPKIYDPGIAEESIWNTGEMVRDEDGYVASEYKDRKRQVCFKLTQNQTVYNNEVKSRLQLGMQEGDCSPNHILPILNHFNASHDVRYKLDISDERFNVIRCYGGECIQLSDYPYALVYPHSDEGDLFDYSFHQGIHRRAEIIDIGRQIAKAMKLMHEKNVIHRNLSLRSMVMLPFDSEKQNPQRIWALTNLSGASYDIKAALMGAICHDGSIPFETGLLPPEMFTKITRSEEKKYNSYWEKIEEMFGFRVDRSIRKPYVDPSTGCSYVVRCHFMLNEDETERIGDVPVLPYALVQVRESVDLWCLGLLLYNLCTGGRPLFPTNTKTGHLLDLNKIVNWDITSAQEAVYENVNDHVAQDLLLRLLAPFEERSNMTAEDVLSHPFFSLDQESLACQKLIETHQVGSANYLRKRERMRMSKYEEDWLSSRTCSVNCWNFDMLKLIYRSSSEVIRKLIGIENTMPLSFILLPYKLSSKNKKGKLSPTTKKDVERAELMGVMILSLAKTLSFGVAMEDAINNSGNRHKWDATSLLDAVKLPAESYDEVKKEFFKTAAEHVEAFRANPRSMILKLVQRRYSEIRGIFRSARKAFLYLVDEYTGTPLVGPSHSPYPLEISESNIENCLSKILPFMHTCSMVVRGSSGGISGLVRLIFEAAFPHVPPSWSEAGTGLKHTLEEDLITKEVVLLYRSISSLQSSGENRSIGDDLSMLRSMFARVDHTGNFGSLRRVKCATSCFWVTPESAKLIEQACEKYDFDQAMKIQADIESKLSLQEQRIKQLQDKIELMLWHKEMKLNVPGSEAPNGK